MRWIAAVTTASHGCMPAALSFSIWSIRMTELRAIMPVSASTPRMATKPSGACASSKAATTPISPSGATLSTSSTRWKLCSWNIRMVSTSSIITGTTASTDAFAFAALLHRAAGRDPVAGRQRRRELVDRRAARLAPPSPAARPAPHRPAPSGSGRGPAARRSDIPACIRTLAICRSGTTLPLGSGICSERIDSSEVRCACSARATTSMR